MKDRPTITAISGPAELLDQVFEFVGVSWARVRAIFAQQRFELRGV
jgi:hypothetical protein